MTTHAQSAPRLAALLLALTLAGCGGGQATPAQQEGTAQPEAQEEATSVQPEAQATGAARTDEASLTVDASNGLVPGIFQMRTLNGDDTAAAIDEYLNSGYNAAAYQLMLYPDGGGLLYTGRTYSGVTYRPGTLRIDGVEAQVQIADGQLVVLWGSDAMVFDVRGTEPGTRMANAVLAGRYAQRGDQDELLDRLRLRADGTGAYRRAGRKRLTKVFWGTEPVFGEDFVMVEGVAYAFDYRRETGSDPVRYDLVIHDDQHTRLTSLGD